MDARALFKTTAAIVSALVLATAASAQTSTTKKTTSQTKVVKPAPVSNPCAQYGAGFVKLPGSDSCMRIGGSLEAGTEYSRPAR